MSTRVVVVGGGAMGLSTAWALTKAGATPVVLERFERGHTRGASHGATRNFNDAYVQDHYLDLLVRAKELWADLSTASDEPMLRLHGLLTRGRDAHLAAVHAKHAERGIDSALLDATEASGRWPGLRFDGPVLHSRSAGVARAADALLELERRITAAGGSVRWSTPVASVDPSGQVTLADGGVVEGDAVVVTAGAWSSQLVPFDLPPLTVTEEHPAHFQARIPDDWPSFNHLLDDAWPADVYGMPTPGEGVKVGFHHVGYAVDPDDRRHGMHTLPRLREYVREWMPGLDPDTAVPISCTYTSTVSEDFVLDRRGVVTVGAGFAGHGFKFVPAVGEVLARLATDSSFRAAKPFRLPG